MGFHITEPQLDALFQTWQNNYDIYAPRLFSGGGRFSDTDCVRYGKISRADEIVFDKKSNYSFKEVRRRFRRHCFSLQKIRRRKPTLPKKALSFSSEAVICMH